MVTERFQRWRWAAAVRMAAVLAAALWARRGAAEESADAQIVEKWVEVRRMISREEQEWRVGRELIESRIEVLSREIESYRTRIAETTNEVGEVDRKLADAKAQLAALSEGTAGLGDTVTNLEARLTALLTRAPAPLQERVRPLSQRMPRGTEAARVSLSERFQNVVGILNEINKFARELHVTSEVRDLPDGGKAEVSVLYIGLAQAYFGNASGVAGVGRPGEAGWEWEVDETLADAVATAIGVYRNERPAVYVQLPVMLR